MITVSKKQTHVKFFLWCDELWQTFCGDSYYATRNPNICFYIRTMTLKPFTVFFCHLLVFVFLLWVFVGFPVYFLGFNTFIQIIASIVVGLASVYGAILLNRKTKVFSNIMHARVKCMKDKGPKIAGFCDVIAQWILDKHNKICSLMEVVD